MFLGYLKITHNHLLGVIPWEGSQESILGQNIAKLDRIYSQKVSLPVRSFHPLAPAASSMAGEDAVPVGAAPAPRSWCSAGVRDGRRPPRHLPVPLRDIMLPALPSDVTPCKSPDQRRWAHAACAWHGTLSLFLWIFKLEGIMCFSLVFLYRGKAVQLKWSMKCSPLVLVVTGDEVSDKHSTSSQLYLWMSPSRELARRMCCPWGTVGLMQEQEEAFLTAPALHLRAAPCEGAEGWESCSAPCSPALPTGPTGDTISGPHPVRWG